MVSRPSSLDSGTLVQLSGGDDHILSAPKRLGSTVGPPSRRNSEVKVKIRDSLRRRARATFSRIPKIQVLNVERPSNRSSVLRQVSHDSCTASSAAARSRRYVMASRIIGPWRRLIRASNAASSAERRASRSGSMGSLTTLGSG